MPNWCGNKLTVSGPADKVKELVEFVGQTTDRHQDRDAELLNFDRVVPYPKIFKEQDEKVKDFDKRHYCEFMDHGSRYKYLRDKGLVAPKDGFNSGGYEWCCDNWGTKWNADSVERQYNVGDTVASFWFSTAWSAPLPIVQELGEKFPELRLEINYGEPMMNFKGVGIMENGEVVYFEETEYSEDEIKEMFGCDE